MLLTGHNLKDKLLEQVDLLNRMKRQHLNTAKASCSETANHVESEPGKLCDSKQTSDCETEGMCRRELKQEGRELDYLQWITKGVHYLKLGETHAYMCIFKKDTVKHTSL